MGKTPSKMDRGIVTPPQDKTKLAYSSRDKSANTPEFNRKAKKRRKKAKFDEKARKTNRGK